MGSDDTRGTTLGDKPVAHPAKYSRSVINSIMHEVQLIVDQYEDKTDWKILDPFAGVGGIFDLHTLEGDYDAGDLYLLISAVEIEHEWAEQAALHPRYRPGYDHVYPMDLFDWVMHPSLMESFDIVITSPAYGNRMADHHEAKDDSVRNTYRHKLGRPLTQGSSAGMQWGDEYREFHRDAWQSMWGVLEPGGWFILNVKDHIRSGEKQPVSLWHKKTCESIGFKPYRTVQPGVRGNRQGENGEVRVDHENIYIFQKPFLQTENVDYAPQTLMKVLGGTR